MAIARIPGSDAPRMQWPRAIGLAEHTRTAEMPIIERVTDAYLQFRRVYYHDEQPSISTAPPAHNGIQQAEAAQIADHILRVIPGAVKVIPLLGGLIEHLQLVVDIHSMSEAERLALHNTTMFFLHGVGNGIQPWYLDWLLATAETLSAPLPQEYFMQHPWDALYYQTPVELTVFEAVVRDGNVLGAEQVIERLGSRLVEALGNPIKIQYKLAFTGPESEAREAHFTLLTAAALASGGFLVIDGARLFFRQRQEEGKLQTRIAPLPPEMGSLLGK